MNPTDPNVITPVNRDHLVAVLVHDGVQLLDVAGPVDAFTEANRFGASYRVVLVSTNGGPVRSSSGVRLAVDHDPTNLPDPSTFIVAGSAVHPRTVVPAELADTVAAIAARSSRTASICTGAFVLAAAGLLDGKQATTHWKVAPTLAAQYPSVTVHADAIFVNDGAITTSAGVSAGIDLALALLERDHGAALARQAARMLVVYLQRPGGQSQFSTALTGPPPRTPTVRDAIEHVTAAPDADLSLRKLAEHANVSTRHLTRLFRDELNTTPARFIERTRLDLARALLEEGYTATDVAPQAGFASYESMRRLFVRELGIAPGAYRRRFGSSTETTSSSRGHG